MDAELRVGGFVHEMGLYHGRRGPDPVPVHHRLCSRPRRSGRR